MFRSPLTIRIVAEVGHPFLPPDQWPHLGIEERARNGVVHEMHHAPGLTYMTGALRQPNGRDGGSRTRGGMA